MEQACIAARFMSNGNGGLDASWLPVLVELLGVQDIERLLWQLLAIRSHEAPTLGAGGSVAQGAGVPQNAGTAMGE